MNEIVNKYDGRKWGGGDWSYQVHSNEELNRKLHFHLLRVEMGGDKGIHKIIENEHGRDIS